MFDIGWTELVIVAIVAILVVGPKDLPGMLRGFGRTITSLRRMARDFQKQFDDALRDAELDEVRNSVKKPFKPLEDARKSMEAYQTQVRDALKDEVPSSEAVPPETTAKTTKAPAEKTQKASTAKRPAAKRSAAKAKPAAKAKTTARAKTTGGPSAMAKRKTAGSGTKKAGGTT